MLLTITPNLSEFKKDMEREAKKSKGDRWYSADAITSYQNEIRSFLFSLPFNEKKRIIEAVISPESGGRVFVQYQRPADYVDYEELIALDPILLAEPQLDRAKSSIINFMWN